MLGLVVNLGVIIIGSCFGVAARRMVREEITDDILKAIGLCVLFIGIKGLFVEVNAVVILLAFAIGTNMIGATRLKAVNYLPAIVLAPLFQFIAEKL